MRQRLAVHLIGDEAVLQRLADRDAFDEIRGLVERRPVGAVEHELDRLLLEPDLVEHVLEANPGEARAAHRAVAPFDAGHVRLEQAAAVARALADRDHLGRRHRLEVVEGELDPAIGAVAADREPPGLGVDVRNVGQVIAHEERVVRGDRGAEGRHRALVVRRPIGELDQGLLAGQGLEDGLGAGAGRQRLRQIERRRRGFEGVEADPGTGDNGADAGALEQTASADHRCSSLMLHPGPNYLRPWTVGFIFQTADMT